MVTRLLNPSVADVYHVIRGAASLLDSLPGICGCQIDLLVIPDATVDEAMSGWVDTSTEQVSAPGGSRISIGFAYTSDALQPDVPPGTGYFYIYDGDYHEEFYALSTNFQALVEQAIEDSGLL